MGVLFSSAATPSESATACLEARGGRTISSRGITCTKRKHAKKKNIIYNKHLGFFVMVAMKHIYIYKKEQKKAEEGASQNKCNCDATVTVIS